MRPLSDAQLAHDLFAEMLADLAGVRAPARRARRTEQHRRPCPISPEAVRRHGCDGLLSAVLLDALRQPVGASGTHRHATERERRILRAVWGVYCAEAGCGSTRTVPQRVRLGHPVGRRAPPAGTTTRSLADRATRALSRRTTPVDPARAAGTGRRRAALAAGDLTRASHPFRRKGSRSLRGARLSHASVMASSRSSNDARSTCTSTIGCTPYPATVK